MVELMFYPCIEDPTTGRINKRVSKTTMTQTQAEDFLKHNYYRRWVEGSAIPQPETQFHRNTGNV